MADGAECASWSRRRGAALKPGENAVRRAGLGVNGGRSVVAAVGAASYGRWRAGARAAGAMMPCSALFRNQGREQREEGERVNEFD